MNNLAQNRNRRTAEDHIDPLIQLKVQFDGEFPTNADCVDALCQFSPTAEATRRCQKKCPNAHWIRVSDRTIRCSECNETLYLTSGTFFENIRLVREWLFAVWLIDHRIQVNPTRFSRVTGVSYSTAWTMFLKLAMVLTNSVSETAAGEEVPSSRWMEVITRRSRETEARQSPASEEYGASWGEMIGDSSSRSSANDRMWSAGVEATAPGESESPLSEVEHQVLQHLSDEPKFIDSLREQTELEFGELTSSLLMLELNGLAIRLPGERFVLPNRTRSVFDGGVGDGDGVDDDDNGSGHAGAARGIGAPDVLRERVKQAAAFIGDLFQGVSRKYLQHYVCVFSYFTDLVRWPQGEFLAACVAADAITKDDIRNYVSPPLIKLA